LLKIIYNKMEMNYNNNSHSFARREPYFPLLATNKKCEEKRNGENKVGERGVGEEKWGKGSEARKKGEGEDLLVLSHAIPGEEQTCL
jgi:hypothetical protein